MTVWIHQRKGRIEGTVVRRDETWTTIRLSADAWGDVRRRRLDEAGSVQQYRTSLLREIAPHPTEADVRAAFALLRSEPDDSGREDER